MLGLGKADFQGARKNILVFIWFLSFSLISSWGSNLLAAGYDIPTSNEYPAVELYQGEPAPVDLESHPLAHTFRTRLLAGAQAGPDFAGKYTIVMWGCGSGCLMLGIIDASTGSVIFPEEISPVSFVGELPENSSEPVEYGLDYSKESRLLVIHGLPSQETGAGSYYYQFENGVFELISSVAW